MENKCKDCMHYKKRGTVGFCKLNTKIVKSNDVRECFEIEKVELIDDIITDLEIQKIEKKIVKIIIKDGKKKYIY